MPFGVFAIKFTTTMSRKIIKFKDRAEWLSARTLGIGASEVSTVLGLNPYETPYQLWRKKKGLDAPQSETFAMRAGHYLEDAVAKFYSDASGVHIIQSSAEDFMYVNSDKPHLRVSPDRTFWRAGVKRSESNKEILECKTTQKEIDENNIPMNWFCQIQMNLGVAELRQGALAWLTMGRNFGYKDIAFDADFFAYMTDAVDKFWVDNIIGNQEPLPINVDDILIKNPRHVANKVVKADEILVSNCEELKILKDEIATLEERKKELESNVKMAIGDAEALVFGETNQTILATWKANKDGVKFNQKQFETEHPDLFKNYLKPTIGSRVFKLK